MKLILGQTLGLNQLAEPGFSRKVALRRAAMIPIAIRLVASNRVKPHDLPRKDCGPEGISVPSNDDVREDSGQAGDSRQERQQGEGGRRRKGPDVCSGE